MEPCILIIFTVIFFLFILFLLAFFIHKIRVANIKKMAEELGLSLSTTKNNPEFLEQFKGFKLFSMRNSSKVRNLMTGTIQKLEVFIFDYVYKTASPMGKRQIWNQTVILLQTDKMNLPYFCLEPRGIYNYPRISTEDLHLVNLEEISYILEIRADQKQCGFITPEVIEFLESHKQLNIEGQQNQLICYTMLRTVSASDLPTFLENGLTALDLFQSLSSSA